MKTLISTSYRAYRHTGVKTENVQPKLLTRDHKVEGNFYEYYYGRLDYTYILYPPPPFVNQPVNEQNHLYIIYILNIVNKLLL